MSDIFFKFMKARETSMKKAQELRHNMTEIDGLNWHWVEIGQGYPIVLLHGIPESWASWRHQMLVLSNQFRVIAIDLKGYGQSGKPEGNYTGSNVAKEVVALLDFLNIKDFYLGGHDWGVMIADNIINQVPDRVERYVRCSLSLHEYDPRNSLHHQWNGHNPEKASSLMKNADAYVRVWFDTSCFEETKLSEKELRRVIKEFSYEGIAECVPKYFRDTKKSDPIDYTKFVMPILYVHGEFDPRQPLDYARGMEKYLPGLEAILILECGHFVTLEKPIEVSNAMNWFFHSMLASGLPV